MFGSTVGQVVLVITGSICTPGWCAATSTESAADEPTPATPTAAGGFVPLLNGEDLAGWKTKGNWVVEEGAVTLQPRKGESGAQRFDHYLWSEKRYGSFVLDLEFKTNGDSGVYFHVADPARPLSPGCEVQIVADRMCGELIVGGARKPPRNSRVLTGRWNRLVLAVRGSHVLVELNGTKVMEAMIGAANRQDASGRLGFQDVAQPVSYRHVRIKELTGAESAAPRNLPADVVMFDGPGTSAAPPSAFDPAKVNLRALRMAIEDLARDFPTAYSKAPEYLRRLAEIEARLGPGDAEQTTGDPQAQSLRTEALSANPLLDFDRLLLIRRRDAAALPPDERPLQGMPFPNDPIGHLNGLPTNFQGLGALTKLQPLFDNEIAVLSPLRPEGKLTTIYRPEKPAYVGDMDLHFDARRVLFTSMGAGGRWHIFEIGTDGRGLRQVTPNDEPDLDYYDACYLPNGRIIFGSSAPFQSVPCERRLDEVANLFISEADGSKRRRLCFDQDHDFYPTAMADGRVMYTRWEYTDTAHAFSGRLMTMRPDGTHQRALYASSGYWPNRIFYAKPVPKHPRKFVGIVTGHHGTARAGELVLFDAARGQREADGVVQRIPGFGKKVQPQLTDHLVDKTWPKFLHPLPLSDKYFLVSCKPMPQSNWGIYLVDVFDNMLLIREEPGQVLFQPIPLRKRPRPPSIPDSTTPGTREGLVYLVDIYRGDGLRGVPRGTVKKLRVFTYHFNYYQTSYLGDPVGADGPWDVRRVLGTVPVEEDGSAYFRVPANMPIAVQPLDVEGKSLQLMRSWFTAMPGEKISCVGCHEPDSAAPPVKRMAALKRLPASITPWHGPLRGFAFSREVQPALDRYCVGCHNGQPRSDGRHLPDLRSGPPVRFEAAGTRSEAEFPLSFWHLRRRIRSPGLEGPPVVPVTDYHADSNLLVQMLRGGHHGVRLDDEAWDRLVTWMDMNAPAYGTWLEMPTVTPRRSFVEHAARRRKECLARYGGVDDDPEARPAAPVAVIPVLPPRVPPAAEVRVEGWPFAADEAARRQAAVGPQREWLVNLGDNTTLTMVLVPAGEFVMGDRNGADDERPCRMKIDRPFWLSKFEVTNEQYRSFDPSHTSGVEPILGLKWDIGHFPSLDGPQQPVCRVSWQEAMAFCRWLSGQTGKPFSLPTESQWEWACRAGTNTASSFGDSSGDYAAFANLADASYLWLCQSELMPPFPLADADVNDGQTVSAPVISTIGPWRKPNAWGLHDMHGNVAEWTSSVYSPQASAGDGTGPTARGDRRVVRGGSWADPARFAGSARRVSFCSWQRVYNVGFRVTCAVGGGVPTVVESR